jgi:hypothetical protein
MADAGKQYTATPKVAILRRRLRKHVAVSDVCDEHSIQIWDNGPPFVVRNSRVRQVV